MDTDSIPEGTPHELFHAFMDHSPAVAFMKDDHGRYVYVNRMWQEQFGIRADRILFTTDADWMPAMLARQNTENDHIVLITNKALSTVEIVPTPDETSMVWKVVKFPFRDSMGNRYVGGVAIDITPQHEMAKELKELVAVLNAQKKMLIEANKELQDALGNSELSV